MTHQAQNISTEAQTAFIEARRLAREIDHHYMMGRTNDPRREWHVAQARVKEPLLSKAKTRSMS